MFQKVYDEMKCEWGMHSAGELAMGESNGHVGKHIEFGWIRGWQDVGKRNLEGRLLLVLSGEGTMCVKHMAQERGKEEGYIHNERKVTFIMGENEKKIDCVLT